jgi:hypothetical protein
MSLSRSQNLYAVRCAMLQHFALQTMPKTMTTLCSSALLAIATKKRQIAATYLAQVTYNNAE